MIEFRIDRRSGTPPYLQIVEQVQQALLLDRLREGDRLPPAREVVAVTPINPNTVLKAYRELEHLGLAEGRVGAGTFITRSTARPQVDPRGELGVALTDWLSAARTAGLTRHEIETWLQAALDDAFPPAPPPTTPAAGGVATNLGSTR